MIGTMGDVAIGSAIVQGIPGFDVEVCGFFLFFFLYFFCYIYLFIYF